MTVTRLGDLGHIAAPGTASKRVVHLQVTNAFDDLSIRVAGPGGAGTARRGVGVEVRDGRLTPEKAGVRPRPPCPARRVGT